MSATLIPEIESLRNIIVHDPIIIDVQDQSIKGLLKQYFLIMYNYEKYMILYTLIALGYIKGKSLFFVNSTNEAFHLKLFLAQFTIKAIVLNDDLPMNSRRNIIEQFNSGTFIYLIATDEVFCNDNVDDSEDSVTKGKISQVSSSRGIDFIGVRTVVNVELPTSYKSYTHRIGRTARGGKTGEAISLVTVSEQV
uniref:RNA helicase n=1 Tax=Lygus hesperus TaxID=30085 RepID=A0A0A9Y6H7_LYGHE